MHPGIVTLCLALLSIVSLKTFGRGMCQLCSSGPRRLRQLVSEFSGEDKRLQQEIFDKSEARELLKRKLVKETRKAKELSVLIATARKKTNKFVRHQKAVKRIAKASRHLQQLENQLTQQTNLVRRIQSEIDALTSQVEKILSRKGDKLLKKFDANIARQKQIIEQVGAELVDAQEKIKVVEKKVKQREQLAAELPYESFKHRGTLVNAKSKIDRMEEIIQAREAKAAESFDKLNTPPPAERESMKELRTRFDMGFQIFDSALESVQKSVHANIENINALIIAADPSIERSYNRLCRQILLAHSWAAQSDGAENTLAQHWETAKESLDDSEITERLKKTLQIGRKHNILINQRLFKASCAAQRLHILKMLLAILPPIGGGEFSLYKESVRAICSYVHGSWRLEQLSCDQTTGTASFDQKVAELENRVQVSFIALAKAPSLTDNERKKLHNGLKTAIKVLAIERAEQKHAVEKFEAMTATAVETKRELLKFAASDRLSACQPVLSSIERSAEVLTVTFEALQRSESKTTNAN